MSHKFILNIFNKWFKSNKTNFTYFEVTSEVVLLNNRKFITKSNFHNCYQIATYIEEWEKDFKILPEGSVGLIGIETFCITDELEKLIKRINSIRNCK